MNALAVLAAVVGAQSIDPVIVTATRREIPADEALASVEIVPRDLLLRQPGADLPDALRHVPGLEVARLGGPGQQTSLFLRGSESNHVLVLVDGLRINPGTIGTASIQNVAPEFVERVEVVKGPRSTLYGSDAIGGVVNVILRSVPDGASLQAGYGSFGTRSASLAAGFGGERAGGSLSASWLESDGFPTRAGDTVDRGHENRSLAASAHADAGPVRLGLRAWYAEGTTQYSDFLIAPLDQDFENAALALTAEFRPTDAWQSRLMLGRAVDEIDQNQSGDFLETTRLTVDWQNDVVLAGAHTVTAGVLRQDEEAAALSFGLPYGAETATTQVYLQEQASFGALRGLAGVSWTDHEVFGGHFAWNLELGYEMPGGGRLVASAGTGFRAPDATDLFGFGGNHDLDPERSRSLELGWRQPIGERQVVSLTAFRNDIDDLIEFVVLDPVTFEGENRNVAEARIEGLEAAWRYDGERWSARAAATWQDPRDEVTGARLLRRARAHYSAGLVRRLGPHELAVEVLHAGERRDFGFPSQAVLPGYELVNLSARIALGRRFTLLLRAENLFDEDYELASGFNTMGQAFYGTLRFALD